MDLTGNAANSYFLRSADFVVDSLEKVNVKEVYKVFIWRNDIAGWG